ncbi:hypothetical protein NP493_1314g00030 [Ridgeia piscesae]|uniref:Protein tyrosine phosphatase n=1 Tax=Ridgeia piscesae TaxID=27915 RepID=A0AAD9K7V5_RIDPI|nr:hypothetical protein NP493_1314g00030 [Ridgeia piscesae]
MPRVVTITDGAKSVGDNITHQFTHPLAPSRTPFNSHRNAASLKPAVVLHLRLRYRKSEIPRDVTITDETNLSAATSGIHTSAGAAKIAVQLASKRDIAKALQRQPGEFGATRVLLSNTRASDVTAATAGISNSASPQPVIFVVYVRAGIDDLHRTYLMTPCKEGNNYINAVYVHGYKERNAYIIAPSPMTSTVVDMWRSLYDHESHTVIMLDVESDTDDCAMYWPVKKDDGFQYGPFEVELVEINVSENPNSTRAQTLQICSGTKTVVLELLDLVEKWQQQSGNGPITMHCSDGAGRCGLVCAASYMLEHLKIEQEVDVFHAVQHVRTTRPQLVNDLSQYRFMYELALAYKSQFDTYANFQ